MIYEHRLRVRYAETDAMSVAHHAAYLVWFEAARVAWIRDAGFPFADVEASGYLHAVREVRVQYRRPARFDQLLSLRVAVVSAGGPRLTFGYRIYDAAEADGAPETGAGGAADGGDAATLSPLAVGSTEMIWVTPQGRPTRLPPGHPLARFLAATERHPEWAGW
ncbi:MAG TPA: thioesterase family protein [Chloroflexota bacterium]|nr:thioesterase family protein [Chloroflexota bacterium]